MMGRGGIGGVGGAGDAVGGHLPGIPLVQGRAQHSAPTHGVAAVVLQRAAGIAAIRRLWRGGIEDAAVAIDAGQGAEVGVAGSDVVAGLRRGYWSRPVPDIGGPNPTRLTVDSPPAPDRGHLRLAFHRHLVVAVDAVGGVVAGQHVGGIDHLHAIGHVVGGVAAHAGLGAVVGHGLDDQAQVIAGVGRDAVFAQARPFQDRIGRRITGEAGIETEDAVVDHLLRVFVKVDVDDAGVQVVGAGGLWPQIGQGAGQGQIPGEQADHHGQDQGEIDPAQAAVVMSA